MSADLELGHLLGEGVFETVLVWQGRPVLLAAHLARLAASLGELYGWSPDLAALEREACRQAAALGGSGRLRVVAVRPAGGEWSTLVETGPLPARAAAVRLVTVPASFAPPAALARHKVLNRMPYLAARAYALQQGGTEALLTDQEGLVTEASTANVFAVLGGRLVTPRRTGPLLPGVTQTAAMGLAAELGWTVHEEPLTARALADAAEVFLTSALAGITPVAVLDGHPLEAPGPVTRALAGAYAERYLGGSPL